MVAASMGDNGFFTDVEGQLLDSENLDLFLKAFDENNVKTLLDLVYCTILTDTLGEIDITVTSPKTFINEVPQGITSYKCTPGFALR